MMKRHRSHEQFNLSYQLYGVLTTDTKHAQKHTLQQSDASFGF